MYGKVGASAQKENKQEFYAKEQAIQSGTKVGDFSKCPECKTMGRVVWVSKDNKTMGVRCPASHRNTDKVRSKFGATPVKSTKTMKNVVYLTPVA
jgi:hypothetical protein